MENVVGEVLKPAYTVRNYFIHDSTDINTKSNRMNDNQTKVN